MDYLPTLGGKGPHSKGNVGKYSLPGASGYGLMHHDAPTEILESVLLIYTIATFGVLSVWIFLDGKGWVQQKIQMDCTHTFEFEATQLVIGQGNMFCKSPPLQFFTETFALGSFFVFTTWMVHDANAKTQDKQSYRACVSIISDWNTVLHITQQNDTTYQGWEIHIFNQENAFYHEMHCLLWEDA